MKLTSKKACSVFVLSLLLAPSLASASNSESEVRACLKQSLTTQSPVYQVPQGEGNASGFGTYLALMCKGNEAEKLYHSLKDDGIPGEWSGRMRGEVKNLSESGGSSLCYHVTRDADGQSVDDYSCSIRLNVAEKNLGKLKTQDMVSFEAK
jgi:hypothetical protein